MYMEPTDSAFMKINFNIHVEYYETNNLSVSNGDLAPDEKQLQLGVEQSV